MESQLNIKNQVSISIEQTLDDQTAEEKGYICSIGQIIMLNPMKTPCNHVFEKVCIEAWLKRESTCPLDRRQITKTELVLDEKLQKEIQGYLAQNIALQKKNLEEYEELVKEHTPKNKGLSKYFSLQSLWRKFAEQNWRVTLYRTHQVALVCLIVSTSTILVATFFKDDATSLGLGSFKNGGFYVMCGSGVLATMTSEPVLNHWNEFRTRRLRPPDSDD